VMVPPGRASVASLLAVRGYMKLAVYSIA
jgi:hypothetical protein